MAGRRARNEEDDGDRTFREADRPPETRTKPDPDRFREPVFLAIWYAGLLTGYLKGPARSRANRATGRGNREERSE